MSVINRVTVSALKKNRLFQPNSSVQWWHHFLVSFYCKPRAAFKYICWGAWVAQSVERPTLGFGSGHELRIMKSSPPWGSTGRAESAGVQSHSQQDGRKETWGQTPAVPAAAAGVLAVRTIE